jgi:hypothetical protein
VSELVESRESSSRNQPILLYVEVVSYGTYNRRDRYQIPRLVPVPGVPGNRYRTIRYRTIEEK